jgi:hypothetical protein
VLCAVLQDLFQGVLSWHVAHMVCADALHVPAKSCTGSGCRRLRPCTVPLEVLHRKAVVRTSTCSEVVCADALHEAARCCAGMWLMGVCAEVHLCRKPDLLAAGCAGSTCAGEWRTEHGLACGNAASGHIRACAEVLHRHLGGCAGCADVCAGVVRTAGSC